MRDPVREKIQKLLKLAEGSSNINESLLAAQRAQEIAERHNISLEAARKGEGYDYETELIDWEKELGAPFFVGKPDFWEILLLSSIAENNGCRVTRVPEGLNLIGRRSDAKFVRSLHAWLYNQIAMLILPHESGPWRDGFLIGIAIRVSERLKMGNRAASSEKEGVSGSAIIRLSSVDKYMQSLNLKIQGPEELLVDHRGYEDGRSAAETLDLNEKKLEE